MKINWSKTKYVLPLIALPFLFLLNYGYQSFSSEEPLAEEENTAEIRAIGDVSDEVQKKGLANKLDAFKDRYRRITDGETAINNLDPEGEDTTGISYEVRERDLLDSIDRALPFGPDSNTSTGGSSSVVQSAKYEFDTSPKLNWEHVLEEQESTDLSFDHVEHTPPSKYEDPMVLFRKQMALIDSMTKANEHPYRPQADSVGLPLKTMSANSQEFLPVFKKAEESPLFNTIKTKEDQSFIKAILDEELTKASVGDRIRIRVLDEIVAGEVSIPKNAYLFANITGFQDQRVKIAVSSIMADDKILPVNLSIYDVDGLEGLYVPSSQFRDFSKELGSSSTGGMNLSLQQDPSSFSQFYMSSLQRMFTSTSQAVSKAIKQNRANLKYGTIIYLIDPDDLNRK